MQRSGAHIEFSGVGLAYPDGPACENVTFDIAPGDSVALIGPSGCGKSTTLHLAVGLVAPTAGEVRVNGAPVARPRRETAFIPQDLGLLPWKTALQNAMLPLTLRHAPKREAADRAREALERVGLAGRESAWPRELSGGQRQRLALARALVTDADLLLMDEPLSAVDALLRESLQDTLLELWQSRGHTQLFVTHSIEEAVYLGKRILVFSDRPGTVVADLANPSLGSRASLAIATEVRSLLKGSPVEASAARETSAARGTLASSAQPSAPMSAAASLAASASAASSASAPATSAPAAAKEVTAE